MRKALSFIFVIFLLSVVSAYPEIIITQQPEELYNLDDVVSVPLKIVSSESASGFLSMSLICNGKVTEIYKEYVLLSMGEEKQVVPKIPLTENFIGRTKGKCVIKAVFGDEYVLSNEFKISNLIKITPQQLKKTEILPGESITIEGEAKKENGNPANGFIELEIMPEDLSDKITITDTVSEGYFWVNYTFPEDAKAGNYLIKLYIYEKSSDGKVSNTGTENLNIKIMQVPTNLEIILDNSEVNPGESIKVKAILHDQTGEKIDATAFITVKDSENRIVYQTETATGEFIEYTVPEKELPAEWSIFAISEKLSAESSFKIKPLEKIKVEIANNTIILTNTGNVPYTKPVTVKINSSFLEINTSLEVGETKRYLLTAPDGNYHVEVIVPSDKNGTENWEEIVSGSVMLTGDAIGVKEASAALKIVRYPLAWIFVLAILGFIAYTLFKKGYKRSFFGSLRVRKPFLRRKNSASEQLGEVRKNQLIHIPLTRASSEKTSQNETSKPSLLNVMNRAELSLSIKGDRQNATIVCLKIKNFDDVASGKGNTAETLRKIASLSDDPKLSVYENNDNIFFMFIPSRTKTFHNEKSALELSQKIKKVIDNDNKLFKQKIDYGISIHCGDLIVQEDPHSKILRFMGLGNLMVFAKKIASLSNGEILISDKIKDKTISYVKAEKVSDEGIYKIIEIKQKEDYSKFISEFLHRMESNK